MKNRDRVPAAVAPAVRAAPAYELPASALDRWNPDVVAVRAAADGEPVVITIMGIIGQSFYDDEGRVSNTAQRVAALLQSIGPKPVVIHLHSPGGSFFEGIGIYNVLRDHPAEVTIKVLGLAASAASIIAMAADTLMVPRAGFMMIHNTQAVAMGDRNDMKDMAAFLEPFDDTIAAVYAARAGGEAKDFARMMDRETWLGGEAAVTQGLADQLLPADEVKASAPTNESAAAVAAHRLDTILARQGLPRAERRALIRAIKNTSGGTPGAAPVLVEGEGTPGAVDPVLAQVHEILRSIH